MPTPTANNSSSNDVTKDKAATPAPQAPQAATTQAKISQTQAKPIFPGSGPDYSLQLSTPAFPKREKFSESHDPFKDKSGK